MTERQTETIQIELTDEELLRYMKAAHELDITFNQFVERAVTAWVEEMEKKEAAEKELNEAWNQAIK